VRSHGPHGPKNGPGSWTPWLFRRPCRSREIVVRARAALKRTETALKHRIQVQILARNAASSTGQSNQIAFINSTQKDVMLLPTMSTGSKNERKHRPVSDVSVLTVAEFILETQV